MGEIYLKEKYKLIFGYIGIILMITGASLLAPLLLIPFLPYTGKEAMIFLSLSLSTIGIGAALKRLIESSQARSLDMKDGGIIVSISWILSIVIGALPFVFNGQLDFTQAVFEAVSGFTTTGLSVVDVRETSHMMLLWRSIMQFLGGVGLAVIMLSAIIGPLGMGIYNAEGRSDRLVPNVKSSTKFIMVIYCSYIVGGIILYVLCGMPLFDAINHSIGAVSTGGFSTKFESIGYYDSASIELVTIILMILGTINFAAHSVLWKGRVREFFRVGEIKFMWLLFLVTIPLTLFVTTIHMFESFSKSFRVAAFEIVSAVSTSGFSTVTYFDWNSFGFFMLIFTMIIGGGTGSTAGGIKLHRVYVLLKMIQWNIKDTFSSKRSIKYNYVTKPEGKAVVDDSTTREITVLLAIYIFFYIVCVFILLGYGYEIKNAMFEIASCLSTVGLSAGITSPDAPKVVIWTMSLAMFLGRLEFLIIFYAVVKIYRDIKFKFSRKSANPAYANI